MDLTTQTPQQIDEVLAKHAEKLYRVLRTLAQEKRLRCLPGHEARMLAQTQNLREQAEALEILIAPLHNEYNRRPWKRYFLVTNDGGHVHRGRNCSTCFPTTHYGWLPQLSGCDEQVMVAEYGEKACTICFPNAPSIYKMLGSRSRQGDAAADAKAQRQAKREAAAAKKQAKDLNADGSPVTITLGGRPERIFTLWEAKNQATSLAGTIALWATRGDLHESRQAEYNAAFETLVEAIAAKTGQEVHAVRADLTKKGRKAWGIK